MPSRSRTNWVTLISLAVIIASIIALVVLIPQLVSIVVTLSAPTSTVTPLESADAAAATPSPALIKARAVIARVRDEIVPRDGQATQYGVTFSDAGYQTLIKWNPGFKVEASYAGAFESLDLRMPCCDWSQPSRNEEKNCRCGHHQALEGLSKKLLSDGWDSRSVQSEVTQWTRFLFPVEALTTEMERRALLDPEIKAALEELKARGEC